MVVEHDMETMMSADWLVDVGPGAGENGGKICLSAPLKTLLGEPLDKETKPHCILGSSLTLEYLQGRKTIPVPQTRRPGNGFYLTLRGARGNNLKDVNVTFPLGCFIGVAGVSGSGKSSLINETLMPILKNKLHRAKLRPLPYGSIEGIKNIDKLIEIIVFAVSGLWHGASWNFVIWGCINGLFLVLFSKVFSMKPEGMFAKVMSCIFVFIVWA